MIIGIDVSTSKIGWAVIDENKKLIDSGVFKTNKKHSLEEKATDFLDSVLLPLKALYPKSEVRIEAPFSMFSGGKTTAKTMSSLQRFNGMISLLIYQTFKKSAELVAPISARSRCGIKVPRGTKAKVVVMEWVDKTFENFEMEYTKAGNPKPGKDDEADAIIVALSHFDVR
jgi:Holliday junction resolvasome RuvABC endonuclease subunit